MKKLILAIIATSVFPILVHAVPCTKDGQCSFGGRCVMASGERIGKCTSMADKYGNVDRTALEPGKGSATCQWDSDCTGGRCLRKDGAVNGVCGN